jgi:hypothetical protein
MTIHRLLQNSVLGPDDIERMTAAYEEAVHSPELADQSEGLKEHIARKIVEITQTGERDPKRIVLLALAGLADPPQAALEAGGSPAATRPVPIHGTDAKRPGVDQ